MFPFSKGDHYIKKEEGHDADHTSSPKQRIQFMSHAHDSAIYRHRERIKKKKIPAKKGTSLRIFGAKGVAASMTVEAALVLPLFLLFFLNLGSAIEIMRFHSKIENALWAVGRQTAVYGSLLKESDSLIGSGKDADYGNIARKIGSMALSYTYVKTRMEDYLGKEYLKSAPIDQDTGGLHYPVSDIITDNDRLEMVVSYRISPIWKLKGFQGFLMENRYYGRLWTGYELRDEEKLGEIFYLTENAQVFHRDRECSHLRLHVESVARAMLADAVNDFNRHYRACEFCCRGEIPDKLWVARDGECYHYVRDCQGLKRTVREVDWEEASRYRPCSRCGFTGGD